MNEATFNDVEFNTVYVKSLNVRVSMYTNSLRIIFLDNAGKRGKTCKEFVMWVDNGSIKNTCSNLFNAISLKEFVEIVKEDANSMEGEDWKIDVYELKAVNVFNPMDTSIYKRLDKEPVKWKIADCVRALVNGQYDAVECTGQYTDDYAYDDAVNYRKGAISALALAKDLVEDGAKSGWWIYKRDEHISISQHPFNYNKMIFNIDGGK